MTLPSPGVHRQFRHMRYGCNCFWSWGRTQNGTVFWTLYCIKHSTSTGVFLWMKFLDCVFELPQRWGRSGVPVATVQVRYVMNRPRISWQLNCSGVRKLNWTTGRQGFETRCFKPFQKLQPHSAQGVLSIWPFDPEDKWQQEEREQADHHKQGGHQHRRGQSFQSEC